MHDHQRWEISSITSAVLPARPPAFLPLGAVEHGFPELFVDIVVGIAKPGAKLASTRGLDRVLAEVGLEVVGTDPARIEAGKELDETNDIVLLSGSGRGGICGRYGVEERP